MIKLERLNSVSVMTSNVGSTHMTPREDYVRLSDALTYGDQRAAEAREQMREAPRSCPRCLAQPLPAAEGERARYECSSAMCPMKNRAEKLHAASDLNALRVQVGDPRGK